MLTFQTELQRKSHISDWPIKRKDEDGQKNTDTEQRNPAQKVSIPSRLFTVDVGTGVLWVLFNEAAICGLARHLFLKLDTLMYSSSCSVVHRGLPHISILVRDRLCCSVKGAVHSVVRDLQFLGNFLHGIAFISQYKNRPTSFRRKVFVSGNFEHVIEPTNTDAPDTQLV